MSRTAFKFSHRAEGRYYWRRPVPGAPGYEELVSCDVLWFWGWVTDDTSLPHCDSGCRSRGIWGATGMMPDGKHVIVRDEKHQYLAHGSDK